MDNVRWKMKIPPAVGYLPTSWRMQCFALEMKRGPVILLGLSYSSCRSLVVLFVGADVKEKVYQQMHVIHFLNS